MIKRFRKLGSGGDTIVEVMIVLAVLGLSMSISYATANRGLQQARNAQEHSQALGILNSQVELLRSAFAKHGISAATLPYQTTTPFCLAPPAAGQLVNPTPLGTGASGFNENITNDHMTTTAYPGPCTQNSLYHVSVINRSNDPAGGLYDLRVRWDGLGTLGRQQEGLTYRIGSITPGIGSVYTDPETPPPPPLSGALSVVVKAIPPAAGNVTPACTDAASQSLSGTTVKLTDNTTGTLVGTRSTDTNSTAIFTGIQQGDSFTAAVSRSHFGVCPGGSTGVASTATPPPVISKTIYPICTTTTTTTYGWVWGARRADLDGYYYTWPPAVPAGYYVGADSSFVTGHWQAPGYFIYVYSGDWSRIGEGLLYYWLWEVSWAPVSTTSTNHCPS